MTSIPGKIRRGTAISSCTARTTSRANPDSWTRRRGTTGWIAAARHEARAGACRIAPSTRKAPLARLLAPTAARFNPGQALTGCCPNTLGVLTALKAPNIVAEGILPAPHASMRGAGGRPRKTKSRKPQPCKGCTRMDGSTPCAALPWQVACLCTVRGAMPHATMYSPCRAGSDLGNRPSRGS